MADLLSGNEPEVTYADMLRELERELKMRHEVFPRWVANRKLKQETADYRIRVLGAVRLSLIHISEPTRPY